MHSPRMRGFDEHVDLDPRKEPLDKYGIYVIGL